MNIVSLKIVKSFMQIHIPTNTDNEILSYFTIALSMVRGVQKIS